MPRHSPKPMAAAPGLRHESPEDHFVAVLEETAHFTVGQGDWFGAAPGQLEQAPAGVLPRARHGAAREQIARPQVAAVAGVMRGHLAHRPVQVLEVARAQPVSRQPLLAHPRAADEHVERHVEGAAQAFRVPHEVRQRRRVAFGARGGRHAERLQRIHRHHPGRDRGGEVLREERPQGLVFPRLDVTRRPVIHEAETEQMICRWRRSPPEIPVRCRGR